MVIWAHRGASAYAPENTLEAFELAADMKADGVELDIHRSSDGQIMVTHDETIDRVSNGSGLVADMTAEALKAFDFGLHFPEYRGARIPTLAEVYALLKPTGMTINVELKTTRNAYPGIEAQCVALAQSMGMTDRVIYSSFNHETLARLKAIDPSIPIGLLSSAAPTCAYAQSQHANAIHPGYKSLYEDFDWAAFSTAGIAVNPWTVDLPEDMKRLAAMGCHALITNRPDVARALLG